MKKTLFQILVSLIVFTFVMWTGSINDPLRLAAAVLLYSGAGYFFLRRRRALISGVILYAPNILFSGYIFYSKLTGEPIRLYENLPLIFAVPLAMLFGYWLYQKTVSNAFSVPFVTFTLTIIPIVAYLAMFNYINFLSGSFQRQSVPSTFLLYDRSGRLVDRSTWKDKVIVLDIWTRACALCIEEMPDLNRLYLKYKDDDDVLIYSVYLPIAGDDKKTQVKWFNKLQYDFPFVSSSIDFKAFSKAIRINGVPVVLIIDKKGQIVYKGPLNSKRMDIVNNIHSLIHAYR